MAEGATPDDALTRLQRELASERKDLDGLLKERRTADTGGYIRDSENRIRDLEHQINTFDSTTESLDLFADSAMTATGEAQHAERAEAERKATEAQNRQVEAEANAKRDAYEQAGPAEREVIDDQKALEGLENPHLEQQLTDARHKDDALQKGIKEGRKAGCVTKPAVLAAGGIGVAVVIAVILVLLNGGTDDKKSPVSAGANAPAVGANGDTSNSAVTNFAGHYVLTQGLDDPSGLDLHGYGGRPADSLDPSSATIDIADDGTITGGSFHVSGNAQNCHYTMDGDTASGNVTQSATGVVTFLGTQTEGGDSCQLPPSTHPSGRVYQLGILDGEIYLCRSNMATVSTCQAAYPRLAAKFVKQT